MSPAKSVRIDPVAIQQSALTVKPRAATAKGASFGEVMGIAGAFAPLAGEVGYQSSGNPNAAAVLHSAFSALPGAYSAGRGASGGGYGMPGVMGAGAYGTELGYGGDAGMVPGVDGVSQAQLIEQMNSNNLQLLELQALMQNNMQQWTTKSNVLKSTHDAKMAMIQHFAVRG